MQPIKLKSTPKLTGLGKGIRQSINMGGAKVPNVGVKPVTIKKADMSLLDLVCSQEEERVLSGMEKLNKEAGVPIRYNPMFRSGGALAGGYVGFNKAREEGRSGPSTMGYIAGGAAVGALAGRSVGRGVTTYKANVNSVTGTEALANKVKANKETLRNTKDKNWQGRQHINKEKSYWGQAGSNPAETLGNYFRGGVAHAADFVGSIKKTPMTDHQIALEFHNHKGQYSKYRGEIKNTRREIAAENAGPSRAHRNEKKLQARGVDTKKLRRDSELQGFNPDDVLRDWDPHLKHNKKSLSNQRIDKKNYDSYRI